MKVHIDIECTPEEARTFFGLPDVQPVQAAVMKELENRLMSGMQAMDPETLMKTWVPAGIASMEQMQRMFWQQFGGSDKKSGKVATQNTEGFRMSDPAPYYSAHVFCCVNERPEGSSARLLQTQGCGEAAQLYEGARQGARPQGRAHQPVRLSRSL